MFLSLFGKSKSSIAAEKPVVEIDLAPIDPLKTVLSVLRQFTKKDLISRLEHFDFTLLERNQKFYSELPAEQQEKVKIDYNIWIKFGLTIRLDSLFRRVKTSSTSDDTKIFVNSLLALIKFSKIYSEQGISDIAVLLQSMLDSTLDNSGYLAKFISNSRKDINKFSLEYIVTLFLPMTEELAKLDEFLKGDLKFSILTTALKERATQLERVKLKQLELAVQNGEYSSFINLYRSIKNSTFIQKEEVDENLKRILPLAWDNINSSLDTAFKLKNISFTDMSEEELINYFASVAELKNYRDVLGLLTELNSVYTSVNDTNLLYIKLILSTYNEQVKIFVDYVQNLKENSQTDFKNLCSEEFLKVYKVLSQLPAPQYIVEKRGRQGVLTEILEKNKNVVLVENIDSREVHYTLRQCVNKHEQLFVKQLRLACVKYDRLPIAEYSDELLILFNFLESIQEQYPKFHKKMIDVLSRNIILLIQGRPENFGWDVNENNSILMRKKAFIPEIVWNACKDHIHAQIQNANKQREKELKELSTLSIKQLTERLKQLSNVEYGQLVKKHLTEAIEVKIQNIRELITSNSFSEAVRALDQIWLELQYYSTNNPTIDSRWRCDADLTEFYENIKHNISAQLETMSTKLSHPLIENQTSFTAIQASLPTIQAFVSLCASENRNEHHSLYATLNAQNYLGCIQNIIDFYHTLKNNAAQNIEKNEFAQVSTILTLLHNNKDLLNNFFDLILDNAFSSALRQLEINFHKIRHADKNIISFFKQKITEQLHKLRENAFLLAEKDSRIISTRASDKTEFHQLVFVAYEGLKSYLSSAIYSEVNQTEQEITSLLNEAKTCIQHNLAMIQQQALEALPKEVLSFDQSAYLYFNAAYENLTIMADTCQDSEILGIIQTHIKSFQEHIAEKLLRYTDALLADNNKTPADIAQCLMKLKVMSLYVSQFKEQTITAIEKILTAVVNNHFPQCDISSLSEALQSENSHGAEAKMLLEEHAVFKSFVIALRNKATLHRGIDYVCEKLAGNPENTTLAVDLLKDKYALFEQTYWEYVQSGLESDVPLTSGNYLAIVRALIEDPEKDHPTKIVNLAACLFAYWSMSDYKSRSGSKPITDVTGALKLGILQPHPAQVISIFRLLGVDVLPTDGADITHYLQNHLAEIPTGEGKSITLAVTAIILALQGYEVDCACYSNYLSQRDYEAFYPLFCAFGVEKQIFYGTFKDLSERWINEQHGDLRLKVDSFIRGTKSTSSTKSGDTSTEKKRMLLLDELDVFFSLAFCGSTYPLSHIFASAEVFQLIRFIWLAAEKSTANLTLASIQNNPTSGYNDLIKKLPPGFEKIVDNTILAMIEDVKIYKSHKENFVFDKTNGRIGYKIHGHEIEYNIAYRYQTMFAYIDHSKEITPQNIRKKIGLLLECGEFSYAEMPQHYDYIFGATGTLTTLGETEKALLESIVQAKKSTYMPSVYGEKRVDFPHEDSIRCFEDKDYFDNLTEEIGYYRKERQESNLLHPVMVFFESSEELNAYYKVLQEKSSFSGADIIILDETVPQEEREQLISRAGLSGAILLSTKSFCRGTDFKCLDKKIDALGGPHAIGAFFPDDIAEETQLKGRIARQGGNGSFSMVLNRKKLEEKYSLEPTVLCNKNGMALYSLLVDARTKKLAEQHSQHEERSEEIKAKHQNSMAFANVLATPESSTSASKTMEVLPYLSELNTFKTVKKESNYKKEKKVFKTIVLIDATSSMTKVLERAKDTVETMYERAVDILEKKKSDLSVNPEIEIKIVAYRNYNSPHNELLEFSEWTTNENRQKLRDFLQKVKAKGGFSHHIGLNEAAEVAFAYVNELRATADIQQVIWIGDMPPNSHEEVLNKRTLATTPFTGTRFEKPVFCDKEIEKFKQAGIPVHAFWVDNGVSITHTTKIEQQQAYRDISKKTNGEFGVLETYSAKGSEDLAHIVTERILQNIGGDDLVEAYRVEYRPTHTQAKATSMTTGSHTLFNSRSTAAGSVSTSASSIIIPREEIEQRLRRYLESTAADWYLHSSGRSQADKLLQKLKDPKKSDEYVNAKFLTFMQGAHSGSERKKYTEDCKSFSL